MNKMCAEAKRRYYRWKIKENVNNKKALFSITNTLLLKKRDNSLPHTTFEQLLVNNFAHFFTDRIANFNKSFESSSEITSNQEIIVQPGWPQRNHALPFPCAF